MDKLLLQLAIATTLGGLLSPDPTIAQNYTPPGRILPPAKRAGTLRSSKGRRSNSRTTTSPLSDGPPTTPEGRMIISPLFITARIQCI